MTLTITAISLSLGIVVSLTLSRAPLARAVPPAALVRLLAVGSLVGAATVGLVLVLTGLAVVGRIPAVAAIDGWSVTTLAETVPVPALIGGPAAVLGGAMLARAVWRTSCIAAQLVRSHRLSRQLRGDGGPVVVVDDDTADAYAVSGLPGCVVLSRRLLRALSPLERRLVTAHELSHLRHRHHLYVHAVDVAVAANPLLRPVARTVRLGVERWADEDAARVAEDRSSAAMAVASAALARSSLRSATPVVRRPAVSLGVANSDIHARALALLQPLPRGGGVSVATSVVLVMALLAVGAAVTLAAHVHGGFEIAESMWQAAVG